MKKLKCLLFSILLLTFTGICFAQELIINDTDKLDENDFLSYAEYKNDTVDAKIWSTPYPPAKKFLGNGYDILEPEAGIIGDCVDVSDALSDANFKNYFWHTSFSSSAYELTKNLIVDVKNANAKLSVWKFGINFSTKGKIENTSTFSSKRISIMHRLNYEYRTAFINGPGTSMKPEAKVLYDTDPAGFERLYGSGYLHKATIGETLIIILNVEIKDTTKTSISQFDSNLKADIGKLFFKGSLNVEVQKKLTELFKNLNYEMKVFATGGHLVKPVSIIDKDGNVTQENLDKLILGFNSFIKEKEKLGDQADWSILDSEFKPYAELIENQQYNGELDKFFNMKMAWLRQLSKVRIVLGDIGTGFEHQKLRDLCDKAASEIAIEIGYCVNQDKINARYPALNEYPEIEKEWMKAISSPIYHLFAYNWKTEACANPNASLFEKNYYIIAPPKKYINEFNALQNRSKHNFKLSHMVGYIPSVQVEGSTPLYIVERIGNLRYQDTKMYDNALDTFLTTDFVEYQKAVSNRGYQHRPGKGPIAGYIFKNMDEGKVPFKGVSIHMETKKEKDGQYLTESMTDWFYHTDDDQLHWRSHAKHQFPYNERYNCRWEPGPIPPYKHLKFDGVYKWNVTLYGDSKISTLGYVFSEDSEDFALNKTVTASGFYKNDPRHSPEKAVDGISDTYWGSNDDGHSPTWLMVDLGEVTEFDRIKMYWEFGGPYKLEMSNDGNNFTPLESSLSLKSGLYDFRYDVPHHARYIRMHNTGGYNTYRSIYSLHVHKRIWRHY